MIGDLSEIPEFSGDLDQLEKDAATLKKTASGIRDTGRDVHNDFQGLVSCYTAPEADQLFHTTAPVRDKADAFATKLETVSGALSGFAKDARPLVQRMEQLRSEAAAFRTSVEGDHDWRKDQKYIDKNRHLVHELGRVWGEFQELERTTATKIDGQVGGTRWIADDGSHKKGMYGFKAEDAAKADDTPWGKVDDREYTGLAAAWHWTKHNVGGALKGFFVDGVWGTIKGLGHMVNVFDWDTFTKTWKGIGDVFGGISAYIMTPFDWAMDKMFGPVDHSDTDRQKKALRDFGKSLVAYDEWGTNPARAGGTVVFNVLTLGAGTALKLGKAGSLAAKTGEAGEAAATVSRVAKVADAFGKTGRLVDPMTYVGKGAGFAKLKVGDMMAGLRGLHSGAAGDFLHGTGPHTGVTVSDKSVRYPDGSILHENGTMTSPEGNPHQNPIPVESSAADRVARPGVEVRAHAPSASDVTVHTDRPLPAHVDGGEPHAAPHVDSSSGEGRNATSHSAHEKPAEHSGRGAGSDTGHPAAQDHGRGRDGIDSEGHGADHASHDNLDHSAGKEADHGAVEHAPDPARAMRSDYVPPDAPESKLPAPPKEHGDVLLTTGDHVYLQPHLTTIGYDSMTQLNREFTKRLDGYHDVIVHGNDKGFFMPGRKNAAGVDFPPGEVHPSHIIEAIRNNPSYRGEPIRLISCHTGRIRDGVADIPAAQQLANELGVPVKAPTDEVGIYPSRPKGQEPEVQNGGYWRTFLPVAN